MNQPNTLRDAYLIKLRGFVGSIRTEYIKLLVEVNFAADTDGPPPLGSWDAACARICELEEKMDEAAAWTRTERDRIDDGGSLFNAKSKAIIEYRRNKGCLGKDLQGDES